LGNDKRDKKRKKKKRFYVTSVKREMSKTDKKRPGGPVHGTVNFMKGTGGR